MRKVGQAETSGCSAMSQEPEKIISWVWNDIIFSLVGKHLSTLEGNKYRRV